MKTNAGDIAARLGGSLHGDPATPIHGVGTLQDGQAGEIGFLADAHYRQYLPASRLAAVLVGEACPEAPMTQIIVKDVKRAWRLLADDFAPPPPPPVISPQAHIAPDAVIGKNVGIGAGAVYFGIAVLGFSAAGGMLQTGVTLRQLIVPGPRGRNVGMYYTFMGFASVFLPFIVGSMTTAVGEASAVWIMMVLLLAAAILSTLMCLYLVSQYKNLFGYSAMEPMKD